MRSRSGGDLSPSASLGASMLTSLRGLHEIAAAVDMSDPLGHIIVGSPDPTSDLYKDSGYRGCGFEWFDDTSMTLVLRWQCTRESGHPGQHLAGTGHRVTAVHRPEKPKSVRTDLPEVTARNT